MQTDPNQDRFGDPKVSQAVFERFVEIACAEKLTTAQVITVASNLIGQKMKCSLGAMKRAGCSEEDSGKAIAMTISLVNDLTLKAAGMGGVESKVSVIKIDKDSGPESPPSEPTGESSEEDMAEEVFTVFAGLGEHANLKAMAKTADGIMDLFIKGGHSIDEMLAVLGGVAGTTIHMAMHHGEPKVPKENATAVVKAGIEKVVRSLNNQLEHLNKLDENKGDEGDVDMGEGRGFAT